MGRRVTPGSRERGAAPGPAPGPRPAGDPRPAPDPAAPRRRVESLELFQGRRELVIVHAGKEYVLRITRQGGLILTA
jgi:hemin uptake protein HemP